MSYQSNELTGMSCRYHVYSTLYQNDLDGTLHLIVEHKKDCNHTNVICNLKEYTKKKFLNIIIEQFSKEFTKNLFKILNMHISTIEKNRIFYNYLTFWIG